MFMLLMLSLVTLFMCFLLPSNDDEKEAVTMSSESNYELITLFFFSFDRLMSRVIITDIMCIMCLTTYLFFTPFCPEKNEQQLLDLRHKQKTCAQI